MPPTVRLPEDFDAASEVADLLAGSPLRAALAAALEVEAEFRDDRPKPRPRPRPTRPKRREVKME